MLTGSFVSSVIGTRLPGPGTIYLSQSFRFMRPVYIDDRVTARVEVVERVLERNRLRLATTCVNQHGEPLLEGEAWVLPSPTRIEYTASGPARRTASVALLPATLAFEMMSIWMTSGLALASQALRLMPTAHALARAESSPAAEPNPIRP
jgi:hypothetical protein